MYTYLHLYTPNITICYIRIASVEREIIHKRLMLPTWSYLVKRHSLNAIFNAEYNFNFNILVSFR